MAGAFNNVTSPGLLVRSQLVIAPAWKSACVVSTKHPLVDARLREKFCVVVPPSVTTVEATVTET